MVQDNLSKGRLRSAWTHRVGMSATGGDAAGHQDANGTLPEQGALLPGDYAHHQQLHQLHHHHHHQHSSHIHQHQHQQQGFGSNSGGGVEPDCDTPKKINQALSFLQQQQQQLYDSRSKQLFTGVDREILCNALACAGASMADPLMSMVDSFYAGKLGTTALAALGSNGALFSVLYFLCFTALAVLCTQAMASANSRGDSEGCGRGFIQAMTATLLVSCVLVCVLLSVPETLLGLFQTDEEVLALAKTYCMIRALSLPAALSINVSQAAFRSMLDLTTPFCIVMTVNAANYLLNQLLMVTFPYGMAGCGWASVISQYMGAVLFAAVIYQRRHKFGIPEALACAEDRLYAQMQLRAGSAGGSSTLVAKRYQDGGRGGAAGAGGDGNAHGNTSGAAGAGYQGSGGSGGGSSSNEKQSPSKRQSSMRTKRPGRTSSSSAGSPNRRGISPRRSRESSGTLRIDVTAFEQQLAKSNGNGVSDGHHHGGGSADQLGGSGGGDGRGAAAAAGAGATGGGGGISSSSAQGAGKLYVATQPQQASSGGCFQLHRWDSVGSESKLPRYVVGGCNSTWGRLLLLLRSLDWVAFVRKFAGMTTRGMLILSTYTTANVVAARGGTAMMAAHQVVQQQQQLQMSFAWSFLHVGQSMTANLFHSTSAVSGPKAARRLSERIVSWAMWSCILLACGTFTFRGTLPTIFTKDEEVQELVLSAALPAAVMLGLGWNNALEGCLLAADEQPFVVRMYPWAVAGALLQLARCNWLDLGLPGVWVALMTYYLVLLVGFAARYWVYRGKL